MKRLRLIANSQPQDPAQSYIAHSILPELTVNWWIFFSPSTKNLTFWNSEVSCSNPAYRVAYKRNDVTTGDVPRRWVWSCEVKFKCWKIEVPYCRIRSRPVGTWANRWGGSRITEHIQKPMWVRYLILED